MHMSMDVNKLAVQPIYKTSDKRHKPTQQEVKNDIDTFKNCIDKLGIKAYNEDS